MVNIFLSIRTIINITKKTEDDLQICKLIFSLRMKNYNEISSIKTARVFSSKLCVIAIAIKTIVKNLKLFFLNTLLSTAPFKNKARSLLILSMLLVVSNVQAQQRISYALHANILYRFTKYVEWWPNCEKLGNFITGINPLKIK